MIDSLSRSPDTAPLRWGSVPLASRFLLAPLAGYTTLAFRLAVRELGGLGLATTDLVNARALLLRSRRTMELIQTCPADRPVAVLEPEFGLGGRLPRLKGVLQGRNNPFTVLRQHDRVPEAVGGGEEDGLG